MRQLITILVFAAATLSVAAAAPEYSSPATRREPLWPDGSPNNPADGPGPTLEIFYPFVPANSIAATIVICPGGGYITLSRYERLFAEFFRGLGYTAVVVNYRVAPHRHPAPYADAARAIRLLRKNSSDWKVPVHNLALMGGSAGGHLAALVATRPKFFQDEADDLAGTVSARPDRLILAYPVISAVAPYARSTRSFGRLLASDAPEKLKRELSVEQHVDQETPPTFIFHAADDAQVSVRNSIDFAEACWAAGVPAELHVFPRGGHGKDFAYAADVSSRWRDLLRDWLANWPLQSR